MHPPLAAFVAFAFDWLSSGDVALGKGSMGRNLWFKETSGEFARFIFNMIDHIYISKHDSYHDFDIFPMPGQCLKRSAYPCMSQNYSSLMRKLCSSARIEASFFFKQPHFIIKSANNWRDRSFLTYRRPNLHQINLWGGHVEVESTRWLATRKNAGFRLKNPPSRASGWLHLPAIGAARLYASPVIPNGSCQGKTPHGTGWNHLFFQQENTINGVFNFSCLSVID